MLDPSGAAGPSLAHGDSTTPEDAPERGAATGIVSFEAVYAREHARLAALGALLTGDAAAGEDLAHDQTPPAAPTTPARVLLLRSSGWTEVTPEEYPQSIDAVVADTTNQRALVVGAAPIPVSQAPDPAHEDDPYVVMAFTGQTWRVIPS